MLFIHVPIKNISVSCVQIKVGKYIKQLHWLLVICKDNTREQPAPVEGKMPWSAFGEDVTQLKTDFPMNTLKKGVLRYTFEPLIVGDGYARGSTQTLWIYTYDQNDVVHHLHQTVRMIGQADSAGGSRLPVSTLSRVSSRVSTNSTTESLHSTTSEDSQPPPPAYAEPDGHAVSNDSMQDARGRSKGIKKKNSTASKILKPRMTDDVVSTPDEVIKKKTLATVEVYLLVSA
ncbi:hypothetical protein, variant [Sphaeroforma arctica JP610]|uniref:Uncharacterized protein n=1 Tax=Sphaeroforma arctica JP610 TaxID=667725 RepID=A0A0L0FVQ3_9EUKA|nr:hypothetical protein, variant [Sphaeroforma arctica JP610]KNC80621.1 hypothetical protein, variant [Sphaeroforma arctica JP610]|eukprot:XP_014154523.1 hypothetical protein, variant [Sphaeroforma arctica JP610]